MVPCTTEKLDEFYQPASATVIDTDEMCQDGLVDDPTNDTFYLPAAMHDTQHEALIDAKIAADFVTNEKTLYTELALFFYNVEDMMYYRT